MFHISFPFVLEQIMIILIFTLSIQLHYQTSIKNTEKRLIFLNYLIILYIIDYKKCLLLFVKTYSERILLE